MQPVHYFPVFHFNVHDNSFPVNSVSYAAIVKPQLVNIVGHTKPKQNEQKGYFVFCELLPLLHSSWQFTCKKCNTYI